VLAFASDSKAYWYLTRSTGVVALVLLSAIVILGTLSPMRLAGTERWPRFAVGRLHRDLSLLAVVFLAVHIVTSVLDTFAPIGWIDAVVPLHSSYRPLWLGLGALAFDLMLALIITSLVRLRLGYDRWRRIHWLAYASWPIAVLHGLGTGSDAKAGWALTVTLACTAAVLLAVVIRIARAENTDDDARVGWLSLALATPVGLAIFAFAGPFQSGWAAKAGTPASILHPKPKLAAVSAPRGRVGRLRSFDADLDGRIRTERASGGAIIDLEMSLRGVTGGVLRVRLAGQPLPTGGISLVGSQVDLSVPELGAVLAGRVQDLSGTDFRAHVTGCGLAYTLHAALQVDSQAGTITGRLRGIET
jgi:methionine sulfoxide reductase heme-binding subunit